jgi:hypothetical protein
VIEVFPHLVPLHIIQETDLTGDTIFEKTLEQHPLVGREFLELLDQLLLFLHIPSYLDFMMMVKRNRETNKNLPVSNNKTTVMVRIALIIECYHEVSLALAEQVQLQLVTFPIGDDNLSVIEWRHVLVGRTFFARLRHDFNGDDAVKTDVMNHFLTPCNRVGRL